MKFVFVLLAFVLGLALCQDTNTCGVPCKEGECEDGLVCGFQRGCSTPVCLKVNKECNFDDCDAVQEASKFKNLTCENGFGREWTGECLTIVKENVVGCYWEFKECPSKCQPLSCNLFCALGYQRDENGCPVCKCVEKPTCTEEEIKKCPRIDDNGDCKIVQPPDSCCPKCIDRCDLVRCAKPNCTEGYEPFTFEGQCCPTCVPKPDCNNVDCPAVTCSERETKVKRGCCEVCVPRLVCTNVISDCKKPENCDGKIIVPEGECCPICVQRPRCEDIKCPAVRCETGFELTRTDLDCCERCLPIDRCQNVVCAKPECPQEQWIRRRGACCPQCPLCRETEEDSCDNNDDPECRPGFFSNRNGTCVPVPEDEREVARLKLRYCREVETDNQCPSPSEAKLKQVIVNLLSKRVNAKFLKIVKIERSNENGKCCWTFELVIARRVKSNGEPVDSESPDPEDVTKDIEEAANNSNLVSVVSDENDNTDSGALSLSVSFFLAFLAVVNA